LEIKGQKTYLILFIKSNLFIFVRVYMDHNDYNSIDSKFD